MNEIRFRAYCKKRKEFVRIVDLGLFGTGEVKSVAFTYKDDPYERIDCDLPGDVELIQYTGLKDRNGTDIYEGDVLKRGDFPDEKPEFIVRFGQFTDSPDFHHELEYSGWYVERIGKCDKYNTSLVYVIEMLDGIVCGNIYEGDNQ